MEDSCEIRKQIKVYQFFESLPVVSRLNLMVFQNYLNDINCVKGDLEEVENFQNVCTNYYISLTKSISNLKEEDVPNYMSAVNKNEENKSEENSNWPSSFNSSEEEAYISMPFSKN